ncbi:histone chaperone, variant 2 [Chamberlinius hualienensis]
MSEPEKIVTSGEESGEVETEDVPMVEDMKPSDAAQLLKNPQVMAALQSKFGNIIGSPSGYIQSLPSSVKRRIKALRKIQLETTKIEAQFFQEVNALECKYAKLYQPHYDKRFQITSGGYEPNDEECEWPSDEEDDEELTGELSDKLKIEEAQAKIEDNNISGIPEFWLTIFKNVEHLADMVQDHDEPILKHLIEIKVKLHESNPMGFTLEFHFEPNEYMNNTVLTKEYEMKCTPDESEPFAFDGPEIIKCKGCVIDWKKGKNVTVKTIKKKQKHKARGSVRTITKTVQTDSFFNFFNPPQIPEDDEDVDDDTQALLASDFEIGHYIRERIVPRAILYFTGEALDDEFDDDDDDDEADEDDSDINEDDEDEENDPDFNPNIVC